MSLINFLLINLGAFITAIGGIFLKKLSSSEIIGFNSLFGVLLNLNFWLAGACYVFPIGLWWYLLRTMELTRLQPMLSIVYIYTLILSYLILHEPLSVLRTVGIIIIMIGVIMVGKS